MAPAPSDLIDRLAQGWRGYALIALVALLTALPGVFSLPVMDRDEARFAQATAQMLETGDFVRINVQDEPRNKKPIGIHWLQAASVSLLSSPEARAIWAYRIPSVLGVMLAALAAFWAGTALFSRRTALIGSALFAAGVMLGFEAMTAKTDAALCGVTTLALAALARLYVTGRSAAAPRGVRWLALIFWAGVGAGVLIKGPVTVMVAALTLLAIGLWERRWRWMAPLLWPAGPIIAALIVLPWMIAIGVETRGAFFVEALGGDLAPKVAGGQEGHGAPPGAHLAFLALLIFPATLALPAAVRLGWRALRAPRNDAGQANIRFLLAWAIPTFLVFEIVPTKLVHYTLPTYPALALLAGAGFMAAIEQRWRWTQLVGLALFALAGAALVAAGGYIATYLPGDAIAGERRALQSALIGAGLLAAALITIALVRNSALRIGVAIAVALGAHFAIRERLLPEARALLVSNELSSALGRAGVHPRLSEGARPLWVVGYRETSLVFQTRTDTRLASAADAGARAQLGDIVVLEARENAPFFAALRARGLQGRRIAPNLSGLNYANGDDVSFTLLRVVNANAAAGPQSTP